MTDQPQTTPEVGEVAGYVCETEVVGLCFWPDCKCKTAAARAEEDAEWEAFVRSTREANADLLRKVGGTCTPPQSADVWPPHHPLSGV